MTVRNIMDVMPIVSNRTRKSFLWFQQQAPLAVVTNCGVSRTEIKPTKVLLDLYKQKTNDNMRSIEDSLSTSLEQTLQKKKRSSNS